MKSNGFVTVTLFIGIRKICVGGNPCWAELVNNDNVNDMNLPKGLCETLQATVIVEYDEEATFQHIFIIIENLRELPEIFKCLD